MVENKCILLVYAATTRQLNSTIYRGYGCIAVEQNNKRHDFNVDMSVNLKVRLFSCVSMKFVLYIHESRILSGKFTEV